MTTISSSNGDFPLDSRHDENQPPQVVTVSAIDELKSALRNRDVQITIMEKELIETRLQLAFAKTSEDRLKLQLHKIGLASVKATQDLTFEQSEEPREVSANDEREDGVSELAEALFQPRVVVTENPTEPLEVGGNAIRVPLGQHIIASHTKKPVSYSRKRNVDSSSDNLNPSSCASGLSLLAGGGSLAFDSSSIPLGHHITSHGTRKSVSYPRKRDVGSSSDNLNPNSCGSGLDLLVGDFDPMSCGSGLSLLAGGGSNISFSLSPSISGYSLKMHKGGDVAAGPAVQRRRSGSSFTGGNSHTNEGWGVGFATQPQVNMFLNLVLRSATSLPTAEHPTTSMSEGQRQNE
eukprot:CAMPEP_0172297706 /NCGR_PEP_ID=MMETSP1058-20130122/623_1 /TAXON_ID=83371 /ORGANISM="Detonula confervacea, Strain CCMP 353" /LENGTH=348 /DNA_ID=CAMNT_0013006881 /DNA_START=92 /DNA_END=1138 /DNA_ORIENTATION=+